jgi:peptidoglycan LD-endopeptidase LytH
VRARWLGWSIVVLAAVAFLRLGGLDLLLDVGRMLFGTPHERYAARLKIGSNSDDPAAHGWLSSAEHSLRNPLRVNLPWSDELTFRADMPKAVAFALPLRRGQRFIAAADVHAPGEASMFLDLFTRDDAALRHLGNAAAQQSVLTFEIRADADYVLRVQPELGRNISVTLVQRVEPTLRLPVEGATAANIRSSFGAPRDGGRREHEGVDIFARRGTNVLAAADGIVSSVGTNRLGGNVLWVWRPLRGEAHYYAHLDTQRVAAGARVRTGDLLGTVGNTGNARTTAPHLHFAIYSSGGAVDPLPYLVAPPPLQPAMGGSPARGRSRALNAR